MDLTTLFFGAFMLIAALGVDTVLHPRDIVLEAHAAGQIDPVSVSDDMLADVLRNEVAQIFLTPSIVSKPTIKLSNEKGLGLSIVDSFGMANVANALQAQAGYRADRIRLYVFKERDVLRLLVSGFDGRQAGAFQQEVNPVKDESVISLVQRGAVVGMAHIDPYTTALNMMRRHVKDRDFTRSQEVIAFGKARLPPTAISPQRSMLENLEGMIQLFRDNPTAAHERFLQATTSDPANQVAVLNLALARIALRLPAQARTLLEERLANDPPADKVLLATAYVTLAGALLGQGDAKAADDAMRQAVALDPSKPTTYGMWAEVKRALGDPKAAEALTVQALDTSSQFENYAEVAALYFTVAWKEGAPVLRNPFSAIDTAPDTAQRVAPTAPETAQKAPPPPADKPKP